MRARSEERGIVLVMALLFLALGSMVVGPTVSLTFAAIQNQNIYAKDIKHDYAADAAIKYAMWLMAYEDDFLASIPPGEESPSFSITINGVTATAAVRTSVATGEFSGTGLGDKHQILPAKTVECAITATQEQVDCDSAPAAIPMTFTYTISMTRFEPDDLLFEPVDNVKDALDLGFSYVPNSTVLDGVPFFDNDLTILSEPVILVEEDGVFTLAIAADAQVERPNPTENFGLSETMDVRSRSGQDSRVLVRFDVSNIEAGATIANANFELCTDSPVAGDARTYDVYMVTESWDESTVTWNNQPAVAGSATASTDAPDDAGDCITWDVGPDVQAWVDGSSPNYGLRISDADEGSSTEYTTTFLTREHIDDPVGLPSLTVPGYLPSYWTIEWDFSPDLDFPNPGDIRTLSFQATATLNADTRYCNIAQLQPHKTHTGLTAPITTGTPPYSGCPRGGVEVSKITDTSVVYPGQPTVVTYTISVTNNSIGEFNKFDFIKDYLPPGVTYVAGSASAAWPDHNSPDNPNYPYNICDFEPNVKIEDDGRVKLDWHKKESANGFESGVKLCHDYPLPQGATYTLTFQALVNLSDSGSYYNEATSRVKDLSRYGGDRGIDGFEKLFSWPTAEVVVPKFDLRAETSLTTLYANTVVTESGVSVISWNWDAHR